MDSRVKGRATRQLTLRRSGPTEIVQWRALEELLAALAAESDLGRLPHEAFAVASSMTSDVTLPGVTAARRATELLLNPFDSLLASRYQGVRDLCQVMAMAFRVATITGASLAASAVQAAEHARDCADAIETLAEEVAGVRLSATTLTLLPATGVLLGPLIGANPLAWLLGTTAGRVVLVVALTIQSAGWLWSRAVLTRALDPAIYRGPNVGAKSQTRGWVADDRSATEVTQLLAIATAGSGGGTSLASLVTSVLRLHSSPIAVSVARRLVLGETFSDIGDGDTAVSSHWRRLFALLARCEQSGANSSEALAAMARRVRREEQSQRLRRIRRAGVWLLLPLGLCGLPAFLLLTVIPILAAYFSELDIWR